ncbi:hypothetical protein ACU4GR_09700 (plasmid) [Methylobacterium oryzae CBMB20]
MGLGVHRPDGVAGIGGDPLQDRAEGLAQSRDGLCLVGLHRLDVRAVGHRWSQVLSPGKSGQNWQCSATFQVARHSIGHQRFAAAAALPGACPATPVEGTGPARSARRDRCTGHQPGRARRGDEPCHAEGSTELMATIAVG